MIRVFLILIGYCFGMIQTAYFAGRFYKIDMREHGSKNLGTTNTLRTLGAKAGGVVFAFDVLKPIVAIFLVSLASKYIFHAGNMLPRELLILYTGIGVVLGHCYPFYLGFKGGKGVACGIGILLAMSPLLTLILFAVGILIVYIFGYISLASICCSIVTVTIAYIAGFRGESFYLILCIVLFILFKHRANIKRLINGNENKFSIKKKRG